MGALTPFGLRVSDVCLTRAPKSLVREGLLGWVRVALDGRIGLDGLGVRRTEAGLLLITFPVRIDGHGNQHRLVWPLDGATRRELERQILAALEAEGTLP